MANCEKLLSLVTFSSGESFVLGNAQTGFAEAEPPTHLVEEDEVPELVDNVAYLEVACRSGVLRSPFRITGVRLATRLHRATGGELHPALAVTAAGAAVGHVLHRARRIEAVRCTSVRQHAGDRERTQQRTQTQHRPGARREPMPYRPNLHVLLHPQRTNVGNVRVTS